MMGAWFLGYRARELLADGERLAQRIPLAQQDDWAAFDSRRKEYREVRAHLRLDTAGRGTLKFERVRKIFATIRIRPGDVGPQLPPAGECDLVFWKDRRLFRLRVVIERSI